MHVSLCIPSGGDPLHVLLLAALDYLLVTWSAVISESVRQLSAVENATFHRTVIC